MIDSFIQKLSFSLRNSNQEISAVDFLRQSLLVSAVSSLFILSLLMAMNIEIIISISASFFLFSILFGALLSNPFMKERNLINKMEAELPFILLELSIQLNNGIILEKALEEISKKKTILSQEVKKRHFKSFLNAFNSTANDFNSNSLKSASFLLSSIHFEGLREKTFLLDELANNLIEKQRTAVKKYSQKTMLLTIIFVIVSAIIPALFQAFVLIGNIALSVQITSFHAFLIIVILFPLLDFAILGIIYALMPESIKGVRT